MHSELLTKCYLEQSKYHCLSFHFIVVPYLLIAHIQFSVYLYIDEIIFTETIFVRVLFAADACT